MGGATITFRPHSIDKANKSVYSSWIYAKETLILRRVLEGYEYRASRRNRAWTSHSRCEVPGPYWASPYTADHCELDGLKSSKTRTERQRKPACSNRELKTSAKHHDGIAYSYEHVTQCWGLYIGHTYTDPVSEPQPPALRHGTTDNY